MRGITIGIPAYNGRKTLERALDSALSQTIRLPYEILIVDDGSADTSANIALSYALMFPSLVRLIRTPNRGVAAARNTIVANALYDHLTWLDADDVYGPEKLELQYDALMLSNALAHLAPANPYMMLFSPFYLNSVIYSFDRYLSDPITHILSGDFRAYLWASLTATESYRRVGPFNETLHRSEDTDWLLRFIMSGGELTTTTGKPLMEYQFSTDRDGARVEYSFRYMLEVYGAEMKQRGLYEEFVPRRYWEISNFYHRNKRWKDMWRCRAMAAALDPERFRERLETELRALKDPEQQLGIRQFCKSVSCANAPVRSDKIKPRAAGGAEEGNEETASA